MTRALAIDEAKHNVRVNAVSPGCIWTPLMKTFCDLSEDPDAAITSACDTQVDNIILKSRC